MMHLTLKRLEAPGSLEVRWGGGGDIHVETGAWGRDLPDISSKTYDAVMKKFDDYASKNKEDDSVTELEK